MEEGSGRRKIIPVVNNPVLDYGYLHGRRPGMDGMEGVLGYKEIAEALGRDFWVVIYGGGIRNS